MYLWSKIAEVPLMDINVVVRKRLGMDPVKKNNIYNQKIYNSPFKKNVCLWTRYSLHTQIRYEHGN